MRFRRYSPALDNDVPPNIMSRECPVFCRYDFSLYKLEFYGGSSTTEKVKEAPCFRFYWS